MLEARLPFRLISYWTIRALDRHTRWTYAFGMAIPTIKSTYSLDVETVRTLEALAQRWNVSKSKALQRTIQAAAEQHPPADREALDALDRLQSSLHLDETAIKDWEQGLRRERQETGKRLHPGS